LQGNAISTLPSTISGLADKLTRLALKSNALTSLPPQIGQLGMLVHLDVSKNQIADLPTEIERCAALVDFLLAGNKLQQIPASLCNLKALSVLDLSDNMIKELPSVRCAFPSMDSAVLGLASSGCGRLYGALLLTEIYTPGCYWVPRLLA
jgi:Leucine-rich repeat (LRR) protein